MRHAPRRGRRRSRSRLPARHAAFGQMLRHSTDLCSVPRYGVSRPSGLTSLPVRPAHASPPPRAASHGTADSVLLDIMRERLLDRLPRASHRAPRQGARRRGARHRAAPDPPSWRAAGHDCPSRGAGWWMSGGRCDGGCRVLASAAARGRGRERRVRETGLGRTCGDTYRPSSATESWPRFKGPIPRSWRTSSSSAGAAGAAGRPTSSRAAPRGSGRQHTTSCPVNGTTGHVAPSTPRPTTDEGADASSPGGRSPRRRPGYAATPNRLPLAGPDGFWSPAHNGGRRLGSGMRGRPNGIHRWLAPGTKGAHSDAQGQHIRHRGGDRSGDGRHRGALPGGSRYLRMR